MVIMFTNTILSIAGAARGKKIQGNERRRSRRSRTRRPQERKSLAGSVKKKKKGCKDQKRPQQQLKLVGCAAASTASAFAFAAATLCWAAAAEQGRQKSSHDSHGTGRPKKEATILADLEASEAASGAILLRGLPWVVHGGGCHHAWCLGGLGPREMGANHGSLWPIDVLETAVASAVSRATVAPTPASGVREGSASADGDEGRGRPAADDDADADSTFAGADGQKSGPTRGLSLF